MRAVSSWWPSGVAVRDVGEEQPGAVRPCRTAAARQYICAVVAANINDLECSAELSTVTRWQIGGSGTTDVDVPPKPYFGLGAGQRGGTVGSAEWRSAS